MSEYGLLRVNTYVKGEGKPVGDVRVRIRDENGNAVYEGSTDSAGGLPPLRLDAPPKAFAQVSGQEQPFSSYRLDAFRQDYRDVSISNIQIYADSTAVQNISLQADNEDVTFPDPALWGDFPPKIPESDVKPLPFGTGLSVLPEPVVPELVVVHDGVPDDRSAPDYTVGFKDYIKNVVSSEIYASWHPEAIKANILAVLSFTMNRVYSEWYRSKGYDFTITSSTAYDQAFFYGRTIYQEIADLTDELFTLYITRPGLNQPLFTQYSDGVRVVRSGWLSQWGSQELARQGFSALQILKQYYGYDIILREAPKVEGVPLSFPGVLSVGSQGSAVTALQRQLNRISGNYPLIPKLSEDGVFGMKTAESVRVFQEVFGLPVTGSVNFPTWYRISDVFNAVSNIAG